MRESAPDGTIQALTRYNYFYAGLLDPFGASLPGTPNAASELVMDYQGKVQNKLLSTQKLHYDPLNPGDVLSIDVTEYRYGIEGEDDADNIASKSEKRYETDRRGGWVLMTSAETSYSYDRGQLSELTCCAPDDCPETCLRHGAPARLPPGGMSERVGTRGSTINGKI